MKVPEVRVTALRDYITKKDMQRFMGTVNYYLIFIRNFLRSPASLTKCTKKTEPEKIIWTDPGLQSP